MSVQKTLEGETLKAKGRWNVPVVIGLLLNEYLVTAKKPSTRRYN